MDSAETKRANAVSRVVGWLRGGYPQGVPTEDYVALFGVLQRQLTLPEIEEVAVELASAHDGATPIERDEIARVIRSRILETPTDEEISRVTARLVEGGCRPAAAEEPEPSA